MRFKELPLTETLRRLMCYDSETGLLVWRYSSDKPLNWNRRYGARKAGYLDDQGYICVHFKNNGGNYYAHRIAWAMYYGSCPNVTVDHVDRNRANNRIRNLRLATHSQQQQNKRKLSSLPKGVAKHGKKFRATIRKDNKIHYLGVFPTPEGAGAAYVAAAMELFGGFACLER